MKVKENDFSGFVMYLCNVIKTINVIIEHKNCFEENPYNHFNYPTPSGV